MKLLNLNIVYYFGNFKITDYLYVFLNIYENGVIMKDITIKDYEEIIKTVELYVAGCNGTSDIMKKAFHENATINGAPIQTLYDGVDESGPAESNARIDVLDVVNDIAVVRITLENYFGVNFVDFHLLKKEAEGWKILAKAFSEF